MRNLVTHRPRRPDGQESRAGARCTIGLLVLCGMAMGAPARAADVRAAAPGPPVVTIDYENLLNGRYSFRYDGWDADEPGADRLPLSVVGSIVFDGQGNVEAVKFFRTTNGSTERLGRDTDDWTFESGTYTVNNTELGRVNLTFSAFSVINLFYEVHLSWDIALTSGGKGFFINVHSLVTDGNNEKLTANGQAAQQ